MSETDGWVENTDGTVLNPSEESRQYLVNMIKDTPFENEGDQNTNVETIDEEIEMYGSTEENDDSNLTNVLVK